MLINLNSLIKGGGRRGNYVPLQGGILREPWFP
jgi:hypothetical protein